ncbi:MAG: hypothetical protein INQ03_22420 [Candidatus Heimdallarchaeota archaeon]|nr:hypothetical protein [Candidatus Heimdallarchaeota archaeon]
MKFTSYLEGEDPKRKHQIVIYCSSITLALLILLLNRTEWNFLQMIICGLILFDLTGGVLSNVTDSTNKFYYSKGIGWQLLFLGIHLFHPLIICFIFDISFLFFVLAYLSMVGGGYLIFTQERKEDMRMLAMILVLFLSIVEIYLFNLPRSLLWFPMVYNLKLIYGFSVQHY